MSKCLLQLLDLCPRKLAVKSSRPHSEREEVTRCLSLPWITPYPWTQRWNRLKQQSRWGWGQWGGRCVCVDPREPEKTSWAASHTCLDLKTHAQSPRPAHTFSPTHTLSHSRRPRQGTSTPPHPSISPVPGRGLHGPAHRHAAPSSPSPPSEPDCSSSPAFLASSFPSFVFPSHPPPLFPFFFRLLVSLP